MIIFDQVDFQSDLSDATKLYVTDLATNSSNSKRFKVIFCTSTAKTTENILACNGFEKINCLCDHRDIIWNNEQFEMFVSMKLSRLNKKQKLDVIALAKACNNSPGVIHKASTKLGESVEVPNEQYITEESWSGLVRYAEKAKSEWGKFKEIIR